MTPTIKIIGLDLDGTVLNAKKQITPRVRRAIAAACAAGITVLPATGRTLSGVPGELLAIPGVQYALTSNGAKIHQLPARREIYADCFTEPAALALLGESVATGAYTSAYIDGEGYSEEPDYTALANSMGPETLAYIRGNRIIVPDLAAHVRGCGSPVEKLALMYADPAARAAALEPLAATGLCLVTSSLPSNWELNTPTADKGAGLLALGRLLGVPREQVMAIGDGLNDVEMLRKVGHGVAMGNAEDEVKAVADAVAPSCEEDGVAVVIEALLAG